MSIAAAAAAYRRRRRRALRRRRRRTRPRFYYLLTWAPPDTTGWNVVVNNSPTPFFDFGDVPTILRTSVPTTQKFSIRSNTHVVMDQGWEHLVDTPVNGPNAGGREFCAILPSSSNPGGSDPGRIMHIEGALVHGYYCAGDIQLQDPNVILQLQNSRCEQGMWADDSIAQRVHPDVFQDVSGFQEIRIDKVTGWLTFQAFIVGQGADGPITIKRSNFEIQDPDDPQIELSEQAVTNLPNYVIHASGYLDDLGALITLDRVTTRMPSGVGLTVGATSGTAGLGRVSPYDGFTYTVAQDGPRKALAFDSDSWVGALHEGAPFTDDGGDWVPAALAGLSYVSPGYG